MERLTIPDVRIDEKTKKITVIDSNKVRENAMEIYWHLKEIEDILGEDYDLERLRELVEADREGRCVIIKKCHECKHHHTAYGYHYCRFWHKCCPDDGDFYCQYALKGEAHE